MRLRESALRKLPSYLLVCRPVGEEGFTEGTATGYAWSVTAGKLSEKRKANAHQANPYLAANPDLAEGQRLVPMACEFLDRIHRAQTKAKAKEGAKAPGRVPFCTLKSHRQPGYCYAGK